MEAMRHLLAWAREPGRVLSDPRTGQTPSWLCDLVARGDDDVSTLATRYQEAERRARGHEDRLMMIRCLLAEAAILFDRSGILPGEPLYFALIQHRLAGSFVAARLWACTLVGDRTGGVTPRILAKTWREFAAIDEVEGAYEQGLRHIEASLAVCHSYVAADSEMALIAAQSHLQRSTLRRLSGDFAGARQAISEAATAAGADPPKLLRGLIALRRAGLDLVIGHLKEAATNYEVAAKFFEDVSPNNRRIALTRQITCLRGSGRPGEAIALATKLLTEVEEDSYRTGQILLELAEVYLEIHDQQGLQRALDAAAPIYASSETLESLRWRTLVARAEVVLGEHRTPAMARARDALGQVLTIAGRAGRQDLTRLLIALHTVAELLISCPGQDDPHEALRAVRAAVIAAEMQRLALASVEDRWQMKATREAVHATAALLHARERRHTDVAHILESGRADMIEDAIRGARRPLPNEIVSVALPPTAAKELCDATAHLASVLAFRAVTPLPLPSLPDAADVPTQFDRALTVGLMRREAGWLSVRAFVRHGDQWESSTAKASDGLATFLDRFFASSAPDLRGVSTSRWHELSEFLIPTECLQGGSLLISPDPRLWSLPWAALPTSRDHLIDHGPLTLTPSLRTSAVLNIRQHVKEASPLANAWVLDPSLSGVGAEIAELERWRMMRNGQTPHLFYATGHASSPESPLGAAGELNFTALSLMNLPEIVVLNGCWTGSARSTYGRDPLSLATGAILGGARHAVAGVGQVGSEASALVGAALIRGVAAGEPVAVALRKAQIEVRNEHPEAGPMDWAGLIAVG